MRWSVRFVGLLLIVAAVWGGRHMFADREGLEVRTAGLTQGPLLLTVSTTGKLAPTTEVVVGSEVSGTVEQTLVSYNDRVSRGQVLARIRPEYYQAQYDQARAELAKATAQVRQQEVNERESRRECERLERLRKSGAVTEQEFDVKQAAYESAQAAVAMAKATVEAARSQMELADYQLKRSVIVSPIDGIVLDKRVDVGQTVAAALQAPVLFVLAQDLARMDLLADVSEADIGYVCPGQPVTFTVNAFRDRVFEGRVEQIRNQPRAVGDVVNYTVVISVANDRYLFRPGMPADVTIRIAEQRAVTKIANAALRFRPPLPPDLIRRQISQLVWPAEPPPLPVLGESAAPSSAAPPPIQPAKGTLWQFEEGRWKVVPVWTLFTDNRETALAAGPGFDERAGFAIELDKAEAGKNMFKQAIMLADPQNRKL